MAGRNCSDQRLRRRQRGHDLEPRRLGHLVAGKKFVVQLPADGLEDPRGPYLSSSHGCVSAKRLDGAEIIAPQARTRLWLPIGGRLDVICSEATMVAKLVH